VATPDDIAFVVGIDGYPVDPLPSCVNDADRMAELLAHNDDAETLEGGSRNFSVTSRLAPTENDLPSRLGFLGELEDLLERAGGHDFLFYFSGHGATSPWGTELVLGHATVSMDELLRLIHSSDVRQAILILDCCFSGSYGVPASSGANRFPPDVSVIRDDVMLLAASKSDQGAASGYPFSAFTELVIAGLEGGAADHAGRITAPALFGYAAPAFDALDQRPVFKASVASAHTLRTVSKQVDLELLRRLHDHFPCPDTSLTLGAGDVPGQTRYDDLLILREAGIVRCPDPQHLDTHVAASAEVTLTPQGLRLRFLAARGKL